MDVDMWSPAVTHAWRATHSKMTAAHIQPLLYVCLTGEKTRKGQLWQRAQTSASCSAGVTETAIRCVLTAPTPQISNLVGWQLTKTPVHWTRCPELHVSPPITVRFDKPVPEHIPHKPPSQSGKGSSADKVPGKSLNSNYPPSRNRHYTRINETSGGIAKHSRCGLPCKIPWLLHHFRLLNQSTPGWFLLRLGWKPSNATKVRNQ